MDLHDVVENLQYLISGKCTDNQMAYVDEIGIAIDAVKLRIPRKPIKKPFQELCPCCGKENIRFRYDYFDIKSKFCPDCGQAIDWG